MRYQERGVKTFRTDTANYGRKAPTQWTSRSRVTTEIAEQFHQVHLNIDADEHLQAGTENPLTAWKALNRLRAQVGRSRLNMSKWGYSNETETCDCGIRHTMQHLLVCPIMNTAFSTQDLTTANGIAIGCARHWDGTI